MVFIVTKENRHFFERDLLEMHRQRTAVFVNRLRWPIPVTDGGLEVDRYDHEDAIYLLITDERDEQLIGSARLLPTDRSHPILDLFPNLCSDGVPRGPLTWEASRFCPSPSVTTRQTRLRLLWQIICGIMETALVYGMENVTLVANRAMLPLALNAGWDATQLGPTLPDRDDEMTAVAVPVNLSGLRRVRARHGIPGPIIRFYPSRVRVAA